MLSYINWQFVNNSSISFKYKKVNVEIKSQNIYNPENNPEIIF